MTADLRARLIADISTTPLFDLVVGLQPPLDVGKTRHGRRLFYGVASGTFDGPRLRGQVVPGGGDWALFGPGGDLTLDVRLTMRTHDDALIHMTYLGRWIAPAELREQMNDQTQRHRIDPVEYYFRTTPYFETGAAAYAWLNDIVCVGSGYAIEGGVAYRIFQIN